MKVLIEKNAYLKMQAFIDLAVGEISGIGKVRKEGENVVIEDVRLLKQSNTGTTSELDEGADVEFISKLVKDGEDPNNWKLWWHSHANMGVFWSATDTGTIEAHMKKGVDGENNGLDYFVSVVGNKKAEFKARIDVSTYDANFGIRGVAVRDDLPFERALEKPLEEKVLKISEKIKTLKNQVDLLEEEMDDMLALEEDESIVKACQKEMEINIDTKKPTIVYKKDDKEEGGLGFYYNRKH